MRITERCGCGASIEVCGPDTLGTVDGLTEWRETHRHDSRPPAAPSGDEPSPVGTVASQTDLAEPVFGFSGTDVVIAREAR